jgi:hypothetical protein
MTHTGGRFKRISTVALILMVPFLEPGTAFLQQLALHGRIPDAVTHSWWWDRVVMPHETWVLLLLSLVLLYGIKLGRPNQSEEMQDHPIA